LTVNEVAARGFSRAAAVYERARPGYAAEAVAWLCERLRIGPGRDVLDLAAGTGKLTRDLVPTRARIVAVEPLDEMRSRLVEAVPGVEALAGTAEQIPLPDESVDAVVCAQAFHWFDAERALPEIRRVLRPGGGLALVWNSRILDDPAQARLDAVLVQHHQNSARHWPERADEAVAQSPLFGPVEHHTWPSEQRVSRAEVVGVAASRSYVASLGDPEREVLLGRIRDEFADEPEPIVLRYIVDVFVADRR